MTRTISTSARTSARSRRSEDALEAGEPPRHLLGAVAPESGAVRVEPGHPVLSQDIEGVESARSAKLRSRIQTG